MAYRDDITGKTYNFLTAVRYHSKDKSGAANWEFVCVCGTVKTLKAYAVKNGGTKSCGCKRIELAGARNVTHGMRNSPEYAIWRGIVNRCCNPNSKDYDRYKERAPTGGFTFEDFYKDVGPRPDNTYSVDRIDNTKPYDVGNLKWSTLVEQANNRKDNILVAWDGSTRSLKQACDLAGYSYDKALARFKATKDMTYASEGKFTLVSGGRHANTD